MKIVINGIKSLIFGKTRLKRLIYALKLSIRSSAMYPIGRIQDVDVTKSVDNYINHLETAKHYANMNNAEYMNFLQPFNSLGRKNISKFDTSSTSFLVRNLTMSGDNKLELIKKSYDLLSQRLNEREDVLDLRFIFNDYEDEIYFDHIHFSDIGYDYIGKKIAEEIIKREDDSESEQLQKNQLKEIHSK